jgi:hypothetical protein
MQASALLRLMLLMVRISSSGCEDPGTPMIASTLKSPSDGQAHSTSVLLADARESLLDCRRTFAVAQPMSAALISAADVTLTKVQPSTTHCPALFQRRQEYCAYGGGAASHSTPTVNRMHFDGLFGRSGAGGHVQGPALTAASRGTSLMSSTCASAINVSATHKRALQRRLYLYL